MLVSEILKDVFVDVFYAEHWSLNKNQIRDLFFTVL